MRRYSIESARQRCLTPVPGEPRKSCAHFWIAGMLSHRCASALCSFSAHTDRGPLTTMVETACDYLYTAILLYASRIHDHLERIEGIPTQHLT